jgi:hypothetical protein
MKKSARFYLVGESLVTRLLRWVVLSGMMAGRKLITQVSNEKDETSDSSIPDVDPYVCTCLRGRLSGWRECIQER